MTKNNQVLVTGGAGFIGSYLVEALLAAGDAVVVIDDLSTGTLANLAAVRDHERLTFLAHRVSECPDLAELVRHSKFVFHLAAAVGVELVLANPLQAIRTNLHETEAILAAAATANTPLLLTSTSEVYGKSGKPVLTESDDLIIGPPHLSRWSYACSKLMDEFLALAHARNSGLPVMVARLFNTVGPRQSARHGMVLPRFVAAALAGEPLRVHGDGSQSRCFCHVADTVQALLRLQNLESARGEVFNVGSPAETTILNLATLVTRTLSSPSPIVLVPYAAAYVPGFEDMQRRCPDISKLTAATGFQPGRSLVEIIRDTAASLGK